MGRDVLGCAQTGTGKTAGFTLPMIDILSRGRAKARMPRSLILEPTRELAAQVAKSFETYGKYNKLSMALLIGGESFTDQERKLDRGVDVLIATPGRLIDLFERGKILLSDCKILVIDEADRMLDMGFIPDVERIVGLLPRLRQTLFFSATMPPEIRRLADAFLSNPKEITVSPPATTSELVEDFLVVVPAEDKRRALRQLLKTEQVKNAIIFCNRKRDVDILFKSLEKHGFNARPLHGDMPQDRRTATLAAFKAGEITYLVASDVAARGLDIQDMSHVFNFDVPHNAEDYVHRIGRTGRAGKGGRAFTLATPEEGRNVAAIRKLIGRDIARAEVQDIEATELDETGGRERRGRGRGRGGAEGGRSRGGRGRAGGEARPPRHERPEAPAEQPVPAMAEEAAEAPELAAAPAEAAEPQERPAQAEPRERRERHERPHGERPERRERHGRDRRDRRSPHEFLPDAAEAAVGLGDHVPAFLKRPVPISKAGDR
ncbi:MAG TPA: DEAD/DEAH box helicase [Alphaproteobacteria bacterium]|nr:DEAD/DEAH box helicase [Alphaproteobacteria bacterium]